MTEPLVSQFGPEIPHRIADQVRRVHRRFDHGAFLNDVLNGYDGLALMPRGWAVAHALHRHLPQDYETALDILMKSHDLHPHETGRLSKTISLAELTTRKHYPGRHVVDVVINGAIQSLGEFELV